MAQPGPAQTLSVRGSSPKWSGAQAHLQGLAEETRSWHFKALPAGLWGRGHSAGAEELPDPISPGPQPQQGPLLMQAFRVSGQGP